MIATSKKIEPTNVKKKKYQAALIRFNREPQMPMIRNIGINTDSNAK